MLGIFVSIMKRLRLAAPSSPYFCNICACMICAYDLARRSVVQQLLLANRHQLRRVRVVVLVGQSLMVGYARVERCVRAGQSQRGGGSHRGRARHGAARSDPELDLARIPLTPASCAEVRRLMS